MQKRRETVSDRLIDQVGPAVVRDKFELTAQGLHMWRVRGVPVDKRLAFQNLALERGISPPPEFIEKALRAVGLAA